MMHRQAPSLRACLAAALLLSSLAAPAATLPQDLDALVQRAEAMGARTGVAVVDLDSDRTLYRHRADDALLPASNQKILTAAVVLARLGQKHEFHTGFTVRDGWLEVVAGGDPNWITGSPHDPERLFGAVAERLVETGLVRLRGVRLDAGAFGGPSRPEGWPQNQLHHDYCAPTAGLVLDAGCFLARLEATAGAANARIHVLAPPAGIRVVGTIGLTDDPRRGSRYGLDLRGQELHVWGRFYRRAGERTVRGAASDPELLFREALCRALGAAGVELDPTAPPANLDLQDVRTPMAPTLVRMLKDSSNFDAEQCLRVLGAATTGDGSFAGGLAAMRRELEALVGSLPDSLRLADGSGLSRGNHVTPTLLVRVLATSLRRPFGGVLLDALPQSGVDGTLESRFRDTGLEGKVRAKTGTIRGVRALSGVVQVPTGRLLVFSILMNFGRLGRGPDLRDLQERMVARMVALAEGS